MQNQTYSTLSSINVNDKTEKKGNQTYLSWAYAWAEVKKHFPNVQRKVYEDPTGQNYFTDGKTCWVKVGVEIDGLEHIDYLPIMDMRNNAIPLERVTSFDVNKAIQRSATKAIAMHGLGLYIYAGEDMPESATESAVEQMKKDGFRIATQEDKDKAGVIDRKALTKFMTAAKKRGETWDQVLEAIEAKKGKLDIKTNAEIYNEYHQLA
jgi:hypothetical protein